MSDEFSEDNAIERGVSLHRIRHALGWSAVKVAELLGVTGRTIGLWEAGDQRMPDARWRLFLREVEHDISRRPPTYVVAVFGPDGHGGMIPIDAVSNANFHSWSSDEDGKTGVIASFAIDRITQQPRLHRQRFQIAINRHVVRAAEKWSAARFLFGDGTDDETKLAMHGWLTRRVLEAERNNPRLVELKHDIKVAQAAVEYADTEEEHREKLRAVDTAVNALLRAVGQ